MTSKPCLLGLRKPIRSLDVEKAACVGYHPEMFFPDDGDELGQRRAKQVCMDCEIRRECFLAAFENRLWGVWGGTTERDREKLRKQQTLRGG